MYDKHLNWSGCSKSNQESLEYVPDKYVIKQGYSLDISLLSKEHSYYVVGCDADACIMATCFSLWDKGYDFHVLTDYIYTTAREYDLDVIKVQLKRNFGDCII